MLRHHWYKGLSISILGLIMKHALFWISRLRENRLTTLLKTNGWNLRMMTKEERKLLHNHPFTGSPWGESFNLRRNFLKRNVCFHRLSSVGLRYLREIRPLQAILGGWKSEGEGEAYASGPNKTLGVIPRKHTWWQNVASTRELVRTDAPDVFFWTLGKIEVRSSVKMAYFFGWQWESFHRLTSQFSKACFWLQSQSLEGDYCHNTKSHSNLQLIIILSIHSFLSV